MPIENGDGPDFSLMRDIDHCSDIKYSLTPENIYKNNCVASAILFE